MKFYIDLSSRRFVKAPTSPVPLQRVFFKRRDIIDVEVVFVDRSAIVPTPAGTTLQTALKRSFSDPQFLAAAANDGTLNLYTIAVEELFPGNTASAAALLEVKYTRPGEETRTATLAVELQNSVILGTEGTPVAVPDLKATLADAETGTDNTRWMTPLRVWDAIRKAATAAVTWANLPGKPSTFPPEAHTHTAAQITDFAAAVTAVAPPAAPVSVTANSGITSTANTLATAYNTTIGDGVVSVSVGGAPAAPASAWKAKNLVQVLDDILFPTILATIGSAKSTSLSVSGASGTLEIGTSVARTLTATFSRGTILDGTGATNANPLVGAATGYTFTGTGISSTAQAGNTLAFTAAVVSGANAWSVTVAHGGRHRHIHRQQRHARHKPFRLPSHRHLERQHTHNHRRAPLLLPEERITHQRRRDGRSHPKRHRHQSRRIQHRHDLHPLRSKRRIPRRCLPQHQHHQDPLLCHRSG